MLCYYSDYPQVADQICSLHKLCSTQQLEVAKDLIGQITSVVTKKECCHDNTDSDVVDNTSQDSVDIEQQADHGDNTSKASEKQTDSHHSDTTKDSPLLKMEQLTLQDNSLVPVTDGNSDDGWEVVKKKKKQKQ